MSNIALITGASRGIGAQTARRLAADGFRVIINYNRSEEAALKLADEIGGMAIQADVSQPEQVRRMFDIAAEKLGYPDILVNNAGIAHSGLITDFSDEEWRRIFAVNTDSMFYCCKAAIPHMIHQKSGRIINISSIWGVTGASCEVPYSASKAAVIGFTKALAKELGPSGICVNCVAPGVIDTDMNSALSPDDIEALREETPLEAIGTPWDIANAIAFLASPESGFITGQVLGVNGGFLI